MVFLCFYGHLFHWKTLVMCVLSNNPSIEDVARHNSVDWWFSADGALKCILFTFENTEIAML